MNRIRTPSKPCRSLSLVVLAAVLSAAAGAIAGVDSILTGSPHPSPLPEGEGTDRGFLLPEGEGTGRGFLAPEKEGTDRGFLARLLKWPNGADDGKEDGEMAGEESPLESDRPNFTESSATVGLGRFQIEGGYAYTRSERGPDATDTHDLPELLLRCGVAERLELRLAWNRGMVFDHRTDRASGRVENESGGTDLELGFKYALSRQRGWRPRSALLAACTAPAGSYAFSSRQVDARVDLLYGWECTEKLSLNCSTGNTWTGEPADRIGSFAQSASVDYELTERLRSFNEWYVLLRYNSDDERPRHYYDGGLTYLVTPNLQLDWRAGCGLSPASDRFFTGFGLTIRR
jgi:hypothetical protein